MPYLIFSNYSKPSFLEKTVSFLDACFYLGGEQSYIVARDSENRAWSITLPGRASATYALGTCEKILKIIGVLLFPITLIALAIRFLLHSYLSYKRRIVSLDSLVPKDKKQLLVNHPELLQNVRHLPLVYASLPLESCFMTFDSSQTSSKIDTVSFWVNYPSLSSKLDLSGIKLPTYKLKKVQKSTFVKEMSTDFSINFPQLCREILKTESGDTVSQKGLEKLSRLFLAFIIHIAEKKENGQIQSVIPLGTPDMLWAKLLFFDYADENPETRGLLGPRILKELEKLGVLGSPEVHLYTFSRVIVHWRPLNC
ncbi:DUF648 domain-containing protein [Chlamydia abortus]|uniref:DUF648 domain-containing protein n=1 Tax=Chlamydia abortus TaxID=83555 RepID=UPI0011EF0B11|nr:DUF648 domain-containing protein [Chlamydia abortus]QEM73903.1 DUF648 domain-containing protein [Chlamydia abortus]